MNRMLTRLAVSFFLIAIGAIGGCKSKQVAEQPAAMPDYNRQLPPGQSALRLITDPSKLPDLGAAYRASCSEKESYLVNEAVEQSLKWFAAPSSKKSFPFEGITHERARASVAAMKQLVQSSPDEATFVADLKKMFDVYESVGYNGEGIVLFTGYYSPIFYASATKTDRFKCPLYRLPPDLAKDPNTGEPLGRKLPDGSTVPYYTRKEIEDAKMFEGSELVWLEDELSAYIIHVNGSAKLRMEDGSVMYIGYAGKNGRAYNGLGKSMVDEGLLKPYELSLPAIRRIYRENPDGVKQLMLRNESYVFFTEYDGGAWPAGSLGVRVSEKTSLATDKRIYPRGGLVLVNTTARKFTGEKTPFTRFMFDQDTGGAIRAPGRADIFMGVGASAEILAGQQYAEGRLYYFFLKPEYANQFAVTDASPRK